jgi:hypothetical protein
MAVPASPAYAKSSSDDKASAAARDLNLPSNAGNACSERTVASLFLGVRTLTAAEYTAAVRPLSYDYAPASVAPFPAGDLFRSARSYARHPSYTEQLPHAVSPRLAGRSGQLPLPPLNKPNVVGTGVGLYLIRKNDPEEPTTRTAQLGTQPVEKTEYQPKPPRTFASSEVRPYSWPRVLALVERWEDEANFGAGRRLDPQDMVPKTLYLPDGRMVPVCVVHVERAEPERIRIPDARWPHTLFGPGMPILSVHQNVERRATVGCLVSDGHDIRGDQPPRQWRAWRGNGDAVRRSTRTRGSCGSEAAHAGAVRDAR